MEDLIKKIKFIKNKNIILDLINYIIIENIKYINNNKFIIINYEDLDNKKIDDIYKIINNRNHDKKNISKLENEKTKFNYDINYYLRDRQIDKIVNKNKLFPIKEKKDFSTNYLNLIKIINNK